MSLNITRTHKSFCESLLKKVKNAEIVAITGHTNADPDALGSALGLKAFINKILPNKEVYLILPQLTQLSEKIYKDVILSSSSSTSWFLMQDWPETIDLLILVDSSDLKMTDLPENKGFNNSCFIKDIVIIDHHLFPEKIDKRVSLYHILSNYPAVAEMITEFFRIYGIIPPLEVNTMLILGILTDTGHFRYGNAKTLGNTQFLLENNVKSLKQISSILYTPMGRSEKIARLKGAMRVNEVKLIKDIIVVFSTVSTYEASVSRALLDLGADISFTVGYEPKTSQFRISSRARERISRIHEIHLGKIMKKIGVIFKGSGGGHDGAAGCYGIIENGGTKANPEYLHILERAIIKELRKNLNI